jgi:hypothetical protein
MELIDVKSGCNLAESSEEINGSKPAFPNDDYDGGGYDFYTKNN